MMLAMSLGMTMGEMLERMTASELAEWMALMKHEPWGPYRTDALAMQGWVYSAVGPHAKPKELLERIALPWQKSGSQVQEVTASQLKMMLMAMGGRPANG